MSEMTFLYECSSFLVADMLQKCTQINGEFWVIAQLNREEKTITLYKTRKSKCIRDIDLRKNGVSSPLPLRILRQVDFYRFIAIITKNK